jgi:hypothetical protein
MRTGPAPSFIMADNWQVKGKQYGEFLRTIPKAELEKVNKESRERAEIEHKEFQTAFKEGRCYLCGFALTYFDQQNPCAHWLLDPSGFRKRHFPAVTGKYGFFKLQNYLRWVANEDGFAKNINDLKEEGSGKLIELTIRYKKLEWAFSCTQNDFDGHGTGQHQHPHYHFSMRDGTRTIIRFNDFHVPFTEYDVVSLTAEHENPDFIKRQYLGGEGMNDVMKETVLEKLIDTASSLGNPDEADFEFQHILQADEGTTMRGEDVLALYQEAKEKGVTVGSLLRQGRIPNAKVTTIVTPGPGVVEHNIRSGRGKIKQREK